jgi:hypothetical protein
MYAEETKNGGFFKVSERKTLGSLCEDQNGPPRSWGCHKVF